ncbi:MAG: SIS domain-containing protein [Pseudomonadales bacterium]
MDQQQQIVELFAEHIELASMSAAPLAEDLQIAAQLVVQCFLAERKILCCGNGTGATMATLLCDYLVNGLETERPAFPSVNLGAGGTLAASISKASNYPDIYARQIQAIGQQGDVLIVIVEQEACEPLVRAARAARDRDMTLLVLGSDNQGDITSLLTRDDLEIRLPTAGLARTLEIQVMVVHGLCMLIDGILFGIEDY